MPCDFEPPKTPCCQVIAEQLSLYYQFANNLIATITAAIDLLGLSVAERAARLASLDAAVDTINAAVLAAYKILNCDRRVGNCCESAAIAINEIAQSFLALLTPIFENPTVDYFTNPLTRAAAQAQVDNVVSDLQTAIDGLLDAVLCRKDCLPCQKQEHKEKCKEKPWYVQYQAEVPHKKKESSSSSSSSSEEKKKHEEKKKRHEEKKKRHEKKKADCGCGDRSLTKPF